MLALRFLFILSIFLQTSDCKDSNQPIKESPMVVENNSIKSTSKLESIVVEHYGGMTSQKEVMIVTPSNISYSFTDFRHPKPIVQEMVTPSELWADLTDHFNSKKFSQIKNGNTQVVFDGMDYIFTVKGDFGELKVMNPVNEDVEMKKFFERLRTMVLSYYDSTPK